MKTFLSGLMATALVASLAIATGAPANAAPVYVPQSAQARTDIQKADYDGYYYRPHHRYWRDRWERRHAWRAYRAERWAMRHEYRYGDDYYYNRHYYPGYYRHYHRPGVSLYFGY